ncbi:MAG TPA: tetratricopeptide repeat-containing glycosyltransferase family protein [Usitatibacter sp.]|nr:tetratricopeptide repeat-containing glycosyltransferase family protein [Usitatibacter sp.]
MSPAEIDAALRQAAALFAANRLDEAQAIGHAIAAANPGVFHAHHLLAAIAARHGRWDECIAAATRALVIEPRNAEVLANRGAALRMLGRIDEALADYDRALAAAPQSAEAHNNRGVALAALNRHDEAIASYTRALQLKPQYDRARFNRAMSRLVSGDFAEGWKDHESRWTGSEMHHGPRALAGRAWNGREDLRGKTLLLYAEQGLGDAIQFSRYATLAARRGARVVLEVHAPLKPLLERIEGVDRVVALGEALPAFDLHCALMSLPLAFGTTLESIPREVPYLSAPTEHAAKWRERLRDREGLRVGLAWSGSRTLRNDANRSIALARLAPLVRPGRAFVSVQRDIRESDREALRDLGIASFDRELADFRDTAGLIDALDVVVSVDTAAAHLAGAMAKPVWLLLPCAPDWRWMLGREDSPWYPTARLFRQASAGDWETVVERVDRALSGGNLTRG